MRPHLGTSLSSYHTSLRRIRDYIGAESRVDSSETFASLFVVRDAASITVLLCDWSILNDHSFVVLLDNPTF